MYKYIIYQNGIFHSDHLFIHFTVWSSYDECHNSNYYFLNIFYWQFYWQYIIFVIIEVSSAGNNLEGGKWSIAINPNIIRTSSLFTKFLIVI